MNLKKIKIKANDVWTIRNALSTSMRELESEKENHELALHIISSIIEITNNMIYARVERDLANNCFNTSYTEYITHKDKAEKIERETAQMLYCLADDDSKLQLAILGIRNEEENE